MAVQHLIFSPGHVQLFTMEQKLSSRQNWTVYCLNTVSTLFKLYRNTQSIYRYLHFPGSSSFYQYLLQYSFNATGCIPT